jgi:polyphosphate glucokinase
MIKWPADVLTLAIDIGGSGIKASVIDKSGEMICERIRIETPYPSHPDSFSEVVADFVKELPKAERASVGFPGLVRNGVVVMVPSLTRKIKDGPKDPELVAAWKNYDLQTPMAKALGIPTKVANDADIQGAAVINGKGLEFVMTLGTGVGTALFQNGILLPHLELGHAPFRQSEEFEEQIGNAAREKIGVERWTKRVLKAIVKYDQFLFYDHCFVGGGNAKHLKGIDLGPNVTKVSNKAGIYGGARIWDLEAS